MLKSGGKNQNSLTHKVILIVVNFRIRKKHWAFVMFAPYKIQINA